MAVPVNTDDWGFVFCGSGRDNSTFGSITVPLVPFLETQFSGSLSTCFRFAAKNLLNARPQQSEEHPIKANEASKARTSQNSQPIFFVLGLGKSLVMYVLPYCNLTSITTQCVSILLCRSARSATLRTLPARNVWRESSAIFHLRLQPAGPIPLAPIWKLHYSLRGSSRQRRS